MILIIGIVPDENFPLIFERVKPFSDKEILVGKEKVLIDRGTSALISSILQTLSLWDEKEVYAVLAGDIGDGKGSLKIYQFLERELPKISFKVGIFHYILPHLDTGIKVISALEEIKKEREVFLIADAGFMYLVKMAGYSKVFDLFTPDIGELAFLADERAPHPFYTRGFLLAKEEEAPLLIERAYKYENAPKYLLVKGKKDLVVKEGKIIYEIGEPLIPALEAIGGTGDSLLGILSALIFKNFLPEEAGRIAAKANRLAGKLAKSTPATQISQIISHIPKAVKTLLSNS